jgi:hypothetical protein
MLEPRFLHGSCLKDGTLVRLTNRYLTPNPGVDPAKLPAFTP